MVEHVILFFLGIAAVIAVTVYVQRAIQARIRDAKIYMIDTTSSACSQASGTISGTNIVVDCMNATGGNNGKLAYEYEPYYTNIASGIAREQNVKTTLASKSAGKIFTENSAINSMSIQAPPSKAN